MSISYQPGFGRTMFQDLQQISKVFGTQQHQEM